MRILVSSHPIPRHQESVEFSPQNQEAKIEKTDMLSLSWPVFSFQRFVRMTLGGKEQYQKKHRLLLMTTCKM